jgi:hypothetical protein
MEELSVEAAASDANCQIFLQIFNELFTSDSKMRSCRSQLMTFLLLSLRDHADTKIQC